MRKFFSFIGIILLVLGAIQSLSARIAEAADDVTVEVTLGKDLVVQKFKVPVISDAKQRKINDDQVTGGVWSSTEGCLGKICTHSIFITADARGKKEVSVWIGLKIEFEHGRKCETMKEFRVIKGKPDVRTMNCRNAKAHLRLSY